MRKRVGILGGTFDPVHMGHLLLAELAADYLELDEVWMIPAGTSPDKSGTDILPGEERLYMTELALQDNPRLHCKNFEIRRGGFTYTYETMEALAKRFPDTKFYFILGADCLFSLENWKHPDRLMESCALAASVRDDITWADMKKKRLELLAEFGGEIRLLPSFQISLSSSAIRERVRAGQSIRYMVPEQVRLHILERGFYRESDQAFEKTEKEDGTGAGCQKI